MACTPICASNDPQSCDALCGDGIPFVWTVAAGTIVACATTFELARAQANFQALNLACQRARQGKICFITQGLPDGKVGVTYNQTVQAIGGVAWQFPFLPLGVPCSRFATVNYEWVVDLIFGAGALPDGLTLGCREGGNPGQIMGTPTTNGYYPFTIQITDAVGAFQRKQFSIRIGTPMDLGTITPSIISSTPTAWPGTYAAGNYRISYVNGALRYGNNNLWNLNIDNGFAHEGYKITYSGGTVEFPGTFDTFGSQALVEAANVGKSILIHHTGGEIRMFLTDSNYGDNGAGMPNPTFRLST